MLPIVIISSLGSFIGGPIGGFIALVILLAQFLSITFVAVGVAERFRQLRLVKAGKLAASKTDPLNYVALAALLALLFLSASLKHQDQQMPPLPNQFYNQYQ
jgi:hypothetical protein